MNRRRFLELLGAASVGGVVYSFPSVIVPKNIAIPVFSGPVLSDAPFAYNSWKEFYLQQLIVAHHWFTVNAPAWQPGDNPLVSGFVTRC